MLNSNCVSGDLANNSQPLLKTHRTAMEIICRLSAVADCLRFIPIAVKRYLSHSLSHASYLFLLESQRVGHMNWLDKILSTVILHLETILRNIFFSSLKPPAKTNICLLQELKSKVYHHSWGAGSKVLVWPVIKRGEQSQVNLDLNSSQCQWPGAGLLAAYLHKTHSLSCKINSEAAEHKHLGQNALLLLTVNKYMKSDLWR